MHHKNKRTVRKELKRLDHKSSRAKERTALDGGHPGQARGMSWSNSIPQPPILDEVGRHKSSKKRASPKKEKCPVNGTHEWYRETQVIEKIAVSGRNGYWSCQDCLKLRRDALGWVYNVVFCSFHRVETPYTITARTATCIHCWKVKDKETKESYAWRLPPRKRPYKARTAYRRPKG